MTAATPAQGNVVATVALRTAATGQQSAQSREENPERVSTLSSRQNSDSGQVLSLGEPGSPRFIHKEIPIYPFVARKLGKEGNVLLRLALDAEGRLQQIETVKANGFGFAEAASAAIRKSTFTPATSNGRSISSLVLVPVRFVLNEER